MVIDERIRQSLQSILPAAMEIALRFNLPTDYRAGHRPRHVAGNLADPAAIRLILLLAEQGSSPGPEEQNREMTNWLDDVVCDGVGGGGGFRLRYDEKAASLYEINPRDFIASVWPDQNYRERMAKAIVTNSFWMQSRESGCAIPARAADEFGVHLRRFVKIFPNAVVVAAGAKARDRARRAGISHISMGALTPPGSNQHKIRETWRIAAAEVRQRLASAAP